MTRALRSRTTGQLMTGILERVQLRADINPDTLMIEEIDGKPSISFEYAGGSTAFWEEQRAVLDDNGERLWLDHDGREYPESDLEIVDQGTGS